MFVVVELSSQETVGAVRSPLGLHSERIEHRRAVKLEAEVQLQCVEGHRRRVHLLRRVLRRRRWRFRHREHVSLRKRRRLCRAVATGVQWHATARQQRAPALRTESRLAALSGGEGGRSERLRRRIGAVFNLAVCDDRRRERPRRWRHSRARVLARAANCQRCEEALEQRRAERRAALVGIPQLSSRNRAARHRRLLQRDVKRGRAARGDERRARRRVGRG